MSDILDDFENFWYDVDRRWEQEDHFLSRIDEDFDCPCSICDPLEEEKNWASEQMDRWLAKFA